MQIKKTFIKNLIVLLPDVFGDNRGWFYESYNKQKFSEIGLDMEFIQDNHSLSIPKYTVRGIHYQNYPYAQSKLVRCVRGKIFDVAIDLRKNSPTYCRWFGIELSAENKKQLFIPKGFGHVFMTLEDNCEVCYKVDAPYNKESEGNIIWSDKRINIIWPCDVKNVILSEKDKVAPDIEQCNCNF